MSKYDTPLTPPVRTPSLFALDGGKHRRVG
jgi:hypothetical protein